MGENYTAGTCLTMCSSKEILEREREGLLHKFEVLEGTEHNKRPKADPKKVVKCFKRSAVGQKSVDPREIRPFNVLMQTIHYLFSNVFLQHCEKPLSVYNFMFDRFRAIRQDMVVQNLPPHESVKILEPIAKFHVYFGYILCEESMADYDPHINNTHLQECLKKLLVSYDNLSNDVIENRLSNLKLSSFKDTRFEIESIYLLFNLGNLKALCRGIELGCLCNDKFYKDCIFISLQWHLKNYVHTLKGIQKLPLLLALATVGHIPEIRKHSLFTMSYAYSSPKSAYPIAHLKNLLLYNDLSEVIEDCKHFNLKTSNCNVTFLKVDFNLSVNVPKLKRMSWIENKMLGCNVSELIHEGKSTT